MKSKTVCLLFAFLCAGVSRLSPQTELLPVERVIANAPSRQMEILSVFLDRTGFLWIGCQDGLLRYDGYRVIPYPLNEGEKTPDTDPAVRSICQGPDGRLWLATAHGLVRFDPDLRTAARFRHDERRPDTLSADDITCLYISPALPGQLWIAGADGALNRLDLASEKITRCATAAAGALRPDRIHVLSGDPAGFLWVGAANGLFRYLPRDGRLRYCPAAENVPGSERSFGVTAIYGHEEFPGTLWIGSDRAGLFRYFPASGLWQPADPKGPFGSLASDGGILAISSFPGEPRNLLIGTGNGLQRYDPRLGRSDRIDMLVDRADVQPGQCTRVIHRDRRGIFWIGSCRNGLDKWTPSGKKFSRFTPYPAALPNPLANWVTSMLELPGGELLITTYGGGALVFDRRSAAFRRLWLDPAQPERKLNSFIAAAAGDGKGTMWLATAEGLAQCSAAGRLQRLLRYATNGTDPGAGQVFAYARDPSGRHWLGTDRGLLRIDAGTSEQRLFRHDRRDQKSLSHDRVNAVLADGDALWIGTDDGLNLLGPDGGEFIVFKNDPNDAASLSGSRVTSLAADSLGRLWVCTASGLNLRIRKDGAVRFRRYPVPGSDPRQNSILSMIEENDRFFWLGTKAGLARFDSEQGTFTFYDHRDGVVADGLDEAFFFFRSRDHEIFFGGRSGFTAFRPDTFAFNPHPPPLVMTELRIEQDLGGPDSLRPTGGKNVRVELAALDFTRPEKNQYAYRLEGRDLEWTHQGTDRVVLLSGLPFGTYTLRARAANNDGLWNEEVFSLRIRVRLPFHEQYGLAILAAGLLAGLAGVVLWLRRRSKRLRSTSIPDNLDLVLEKFSISKREAEIVRLLLAGKSNKEIEDQLFIAMATVKIHVHNIFQKVKVNSRLQLLLRIQQEARKAK